MPQKCRRRGARVVAMSNKHTYITPPYCQGATGYTSDKASSAQSTPLRVRACGAPKHVRVDSVNTSLLAHPNLLQSVSVSLPIIILPTQNFQGLILLGVPCFRGISSHRNKSVGRGCAKIRATALSRELDHESRRFTVFIRSACPATSCACRLAPRLPSDPALSLIASWRGLQQLSSSYVMRYIIPYSILYYTILYYSILYYYCILGQAKGKSRAWQGPPGPL